MDLRICLFGITFFQYLLSYQALRLAHLKEKYNYGVESFASFSRMRQNRAPKR